MLQKVQTVIEVDSQMCTQIELWDYFVAVGVEHSQMVHYTFKVPESRVLGIVLQLIVVLLDLPCDNRASVVVESHVRP